MQRKKMLIAVLAIALLVGVASAALLPYFGIITGTVEVEQSVVFGDGSTSKTYSFDGVAGTIVAEPFTLKNRADMNVTIELVTVQKGDGDGNNYVEGITTVYTTQSETEDYWVDDDWASLPDGTIVKNVDGNYCTIGTNAFGTIMGGIGAAGDITNILVPMDSATFTLGADDSMSFSIVNEFDVALAPGTYTITTTVEPA